MMDDRDMVTASELGRLQGWMQAMVTRGGAAGAIHGLVPEAAGIERRTAGAEFGDVESIVLPSRTLTSSERLAIYVRSYDARLLQCFATIFPSLLHALGRELFDAFARDYLQCHPPRSYTLDHLADGFPDHLSATRPDGALPADERESWPDFVIDLARLELGLLHVFNGEGIEDAGAPLPRDIAAIPLHLAGGLRPVLAPSCRLFRFQYPVHNYLRACRRGESPELAPPAESLVVLSRRDYRVLINEVTPAQFELLSRLDGMHTIDELLAGLAAEGVAGDIGAGTVRDVLCEWASWRVFVACA